MVPALQPEHPDPSASPPRKRSSTSSSVGWMMAIVGMKDDDAGATVTHAASNITFQDRVGMKRLCREVLLRVVLNNYKRAMKEGVLEKNSSGARMLTASVNQALQQLESLRDWEILEDMLRSDLKPTFLFQWLHNSPLKRFLPTELRHLL